MDTVYTKWDGYFGTLEKAFRYFMDSCFSTAEILQKHKSESGIGTFIIRDYSGEYVLYAEIKESGELVVQNSNFEDVIIEYGLENGYNKEEIIDMKLGYIEDEDAYKRAFETLENTLEI